jgi:hypothetical protein
MMPMLRKMRFTMATVMMMVVTAAVASALFAKARDHIPTAKYPYLRVDAPAVFVISIALTGIALGALKAHSAGQIMLQIVLAYLAYLGLISLAEAGAYRPLVYWFQACFALLATAPLIARSYVKTELERGPRRTWWKKTTEAVLFSFFTIVLVWVSSFIQWLTSLLASSAGGLLKF